LRWPQRIDCAAGIAVFAEAETPDELRLLNDHLARLSS
jgi:hypothetical protein